VISAAVFAVCHRLTQRSAMASASARGGGGLIEVTSGGFVQSGSFGLRSASRRR